MPFCGKCGSPLKDEDAFCGRCGWRVEQTDGNQRAAVQIDDGYRAVEQTTTDTEQQAANQPFIVDTDEEDWSGPIAWEEEQPASPSNESLSDVKNAVSNLASTVASASSRVIADANAAVKTKKDAISSSLSSNAKPSVTANAESNVATGSSTSSSKNETAGGSNNVRSSLQQYMSNSDLWTWLKKDDRRQLFFLDDREGTTENAYMKMLNDKLEANEVPATVAKQSIRWDLSDIQDDVWMVKPSTSVVNPLKCCLQFATVGKFCFVEQKTFLSPPKLPSVPGERVPVPDTSGTIMILLIGAAVLLFGFSSFGSCSRMGMAVGSGSAFSSIGFIAIVIGAALLAWGFNIRGKARAAIEHNNKVDEQTRIWDKAWQDWEGSVFVHSFQESTNGQLTRIYQAVFDCMRQVNDELFRDMESSEEREDASMNELRQQISQRKDSYR